MNSNASRKRLARLAQLITGRHDHAACTECQEQLSEYVEAESVWQSADQLYPQVRQHLETCLECQRLYAEQLEIAQLEATDALPQFAQTPRFDLSFLRQPRQKPAQLVYESAQAIVQAVQAEYVAELELVRNRLLDILSGLIDQLAFQPLPILSSQTLGFSGETASLRWVMATFVGLQQVHATSNWQEIKRMQVAGELYGFLFSVGQKAASQAGLRREDAQQFAEAFARTHSEDRWNDLVVWMTVSSSDAAQKNQDPGSSPA